MSVDRDLDIEAEYIMVRPRCGLHDVDLQDIGSGFRMSRSTDRGWYESDLSEFGCPRVGRFLEGLITDKAADNMIEQDNGSWYLDVQIMTRSPQ